MMKTTGVLSRVARLGRRISASPVAKATRMQTSEGHLGGYLTGRAAPGTWCPDIWNWLIKEHGVRSMLDVGCGLGYVMKYFHDNGCDVQGVDGSPGAVADNVLASHVCKHDFSTGAWAPDRTFDLVWSSEFLEHVEEKYIRNFMSAFNRSTSLAVVTYATPGQGGHHHVNENTEAYWVTQFEAYGFRMDSSLTEIARSLVPPVGVEGKQFRGKGIVFTRAQEVGD